MKPKVTVLMPVYNGARYLKEAMDSILSQTFKDFEFLIMNDGSTDDSLEIINNYSDARIVVASQDNQGLSATLNRGLALAQGEYVVRMDADDISSPERLAVQIAFMDSHVEVDICGSWVNFFNQTEKKIGTYPVKHEEIRIELMFGSPLAHPSVILRTSFIKDKKLDYWLKKSEDYELWVRADKFGAIFANIPKFLLKYRLGDGISATTQKQDYRQQALEIMKAQLSRLGVSATAEELDDHRLILYPEFSSSVDYLKRLKQWFIKLEQANQQSQLYQTNSLRIILADKWFVVCSRASLKKILFDRQLLWHSLKCFFRLNWSRKIILFYKFFRYKL
jgi:glycosyltransferase involved in cell wall biosynthesis